MRKSTMISAALLTLVCAQQGMAQRAVVAPRSGEIRVNASFNVSMPVASNDAQAAALEQDKARKTLYERLSNECKLLLETIAVECRVESISANVNINHNGQMLTLNSSGNGSYWITTKN